MPQQQSYIVLLAVAAAEAITLALLVWLWRRQKRGIAAFILIMLGTSIWAGAYALELSYSDLPTKLLWVQVQYVGIVSVPVLLLVFVLSITGRERWLTLRNLILLSVIPLASLFLLWTNGMHGLFYQAADVQIERGIPNLAPIYGPWFWVHSGYSYLMMLMSVGLLLHSLIRSPNLYRGQATTLGIGVLLPWIGNALYIFDLSPLGNLDPTPFAFTFTGLAFSWSLLRYQLLDVVPVARDTVFEGMSDAVVVLDEENHIIDFNPAAQKILSVPPSKIIGARLGELMPEHRLLLEQFRDVQRARVEIQLGQAEARRTYSLNLSPLHDRRQHYRGRLIVLRDITDRKKAEESLERAHEHTLEALRVKSRILAIVSHDFRTPLAAILGYAGLLKQEIQGPLTEAQKKTLARVMVNVNQLSGLVSDLLDQAQMEDGHITLNFMSFSPAELIARVEASTAPRAIDKGIKLIFETAPNVNTVYGDVSRLSQVVRNVVDNALKFTTEGEVKVRIFLQGTEHWGIEVTDTGQGMPQGVLSHIFDPFWQGDGTLTRENAGVGLGLSIARQLTSMMGGEIDVRSTVGKGTVFRIMLPLKSAREQLREAVSSAHS